MKCKYKESFKRNKASTIMIDNLDTNSDKCPTTVEHS